MNLVVVNLLNTCTEAEPAVLNLLLLHQESVGDSLSSVGKGEITVFPDIS